MQNILLNNQSLTTDRQQKRCSSSHRVQTKGSTKPTGRPAFLTQSFTNAVFLGKKYRNEQTVSAAFYRAAENLTDYLEIKDFVPSDALYPANVITDFYSLNAKVNRDFCGELSLVDLKAGEVSLQLIENLNVNQMLLYFVPIEPLFLLFENSDHATFKLLLEIFRFISKQGVSGMMENGYYNMMMEGQNDEENNEFFDDYYYSYATLNDIFDKNIAFNDFICIPFNMARLKACIRSVYKQETSSPLTDIAEMIIQISSQFKNRTFNQMYHLINFEEFEPTILSEEYLTFVWNSSEKCGVFSTYEQFLTAHCNECSQQIFPNSCLSLNLSKEELIGQRATDTDFVKSFLNIIDHLITYLKRYEP